MGLRPPISANGPAAPFGRKIADRLADHEAKVMEYSSANQVAVPEPTSSAGTESPAGSSNASASGGPQRQLYRPGIDGTLVREILSAMARSDRQNGDRHAERRRSSRHPYHTRLVLVVPSSTPDSQPEKTLVAFGAWGRNLSAGGMSVLLSRHIFRITGSPQQQEAADVASLVRKGTVCYCGLPVAGADILWIRCQIVRVRDLAGRAFEAGLKFVEKSSAVDHITSLLQKK